MDRVELTAFSFPCIIGILEREQREPQRLDVELRMYLSLSGAAGGDLAASVDYAAVADQVTTLAQQGQWRLLESLGSAICRLLLAPPAPQERRAQVERVALMLRKPDVLGGQAVPGVGVEREIEALEIGTIGPGVAAEILQETPLVGAYRVHVEPRARWRPPAGAALHLLAGRVLADGRWIEPGARLARGAGVEVDNVQELPVSFLVVARPTLF